MTNQSKPTVKITGRMRTEAQDTILGVLREYIGGPEFKHADDAKFAAIVAQYKRIEKLFA